MQIFDEVQSVIYEPIVAKPRAIGRKGKLPKTLDKVSLQWTRAETNKLSDNYSWECEESNPEILGQCTTITEFKIWLQNKSWYELEYICKKYNLPLILKRAQFMNETLKYYETNPREYLERCLKKEIDELIPEIEK